MTVPARIRDLTDQEKTFIHALFETRGNATEAARVAGYSEGNAYYLTKRLAKDIIAVAEHILTINAPKAAMTVVDGLGGDDAKMITNTNLEAAKQILDRVGITRQDRLDVKVEAVNGLFILPVKRQVIDADYETIEDDGIQTITSAR